MKWRDWQLLIILVLLGYLALNLAFLFPDWRQPSDGSPQPTPTTRRAQASPVIRVVAPTSTPRPSRTPMSTASPEPVATLAPTDASMPTPLSEVESTPTPLPSEEPQPTATPTLENPTHVVQEGENLLRIAERYGVTMQVIVERNGLANPDLIYIGQVLVIPLPAPPSPTPSG